MDKSGCLSLSKVASDEELKVDQSEFGDEAVNNQEVDGFQSDQNNSRDVDDGLVSGAGGPVPSLSLEAIPEEVWEVILDQMVKSEDIHNVLLAFPELDKAFQSKKAFWLFGAVLPHLITKHLQTDNFKDVFNLRLVSKRWKSSVDSSLRSHVALQQLPLPPDSKEHQKLMPSEHHFSYQCPQESAFGASIFHTTQQFLDFLTAMIRPSGNPFPGKYVAVKLSDSNIHLALALFEKFGKHVQHLEIKFNGGRICHLQLCRNVLKCLSHLPNLRSLTFTGVLYASADQKTSSYFCKPEAITLFPDLPILEAFTWQVDFDINDYLPQLSMWITRINQKYGRQNGLRKFGVRSNLLWNVSSSFPTLTELTLIGETLDDTHFEFLKYALASLSNPLQLRKLCLHDVHWLHIKGSKLINYLADYKVESLILKDIMMSEHENNAMPLDDDEDMPPPVATSIKSLYLTDNLKFSYDFFKWLPNLQFLTIHFKMEEIWGWRGLVIMPGDSLARKIRGFVLMACDEDVQIRGIQQFSIWEELPKLEIFSVRVTHGSREDSAWNFQFVRECGDKAFFSSKLDGWMIRVLG